MADIPVALHRFFLDPEKNRIYEETVALYRELLQNNYPGFFRWDMHCKQVREMVRREIELEIYDKLILNDMDNLWLQKNRKPVEDSLNRYRRDLGLTLPMMKRLMITGKDNNTTFADDMDSLITDYTMQQAALV